MFAFIRKCKNIFMLLVFIEKIFPEKSDLLFRFMFSNIFYVYAYVFHMIIWYFLIICLSFAQILRKKYRFSSGAGAYMVHGNKYLLHSILNKT